MTKKMWTVKWCTCRGFDTIAQGSLPELWTGFDKSLYKGKASGQGHKPTVASLSTILS